MRRRWILLVVSILVAAIGTALVAVYVRQAEDRAAAGQVRVPVLVAAREIPAGAAAGSLGDAVAVREFARENVAPQAVTSVDQLHGTASGKIFTGEQIVTGMFTTAAQTSGLNMPDGRLAYAVDVDEAGRVAGYVQPGSMVTVFVTGENTPTRVVLPAAKVVAVGMATSNGGGSPARPVVTLALTEHEIEQVADAKQAGRISLALQG